MIQPGKPLIVLVLAGLSVVASCLLGTVTSPEGCHPSHVESLGSVCNGPASDTWPLGLMFAIAIIGALFIVISFAWYAERHRRLARLLHQLATPAILSDVPVGLVDGVGPAWVAGIRRPRIYCASSLAAQLDPLELRAVILHERHHQLVLAPARLILLDAVAWPIERFAVGRRWLEHSRAQIEISADRYALAGGATRVHLARALVKLGDQHGPAGVAGYAASSDLRIRALLCDPPERVSNRIRWMNSALVTAAVVALCLLV